MKPLRSGCRVKIREETGPFAARIGIAYPVQDVVSPDILSLFIEESVLVFFVPDHRERVAHMRTLSLSKLSAYHTERFERREQYWVTSKDMVEVVRSGARRGKKHRMRVKP